ncbi:HAD family hydrolase [Candidatus Woesearchaeota archaeon]|nr:HAD family hydrolase [Candidatus Woesearchaeota archaeon]
MIKLIIFDLDNTLFDTYNQLGVEVLDKMIARMRKVGLTKEQERLLRKKYIITGFRIIAKELGLSEKVKKIGMGTYTNMDLSHITPYKDVKLISKLKQKKALVTSGSGEVQLKKVRILKIGGLFGDIVVDKSSSPDNKQRIFARLMKKYRLKPKEIMVVGDNPDSELAAGKALGMVAVQILRRPGMLKGKADYYVKGLDEVKKIVESMVD